MACSFDYNNWQRILANRGIGSRVGMASLFIPAMFPRPLFENIVDQKSDTLIVRWVQPKHTVENLRGFLKSARTPKAKPESLHAPKEWPIIYVSPRKDAVKASAERWGLPGVHSLRSLTPTISPGTQGLRVRSVTVRLFSRKRQRAVCLVPDSTERTVNSTMSFA